MTESPMALLSLFVVLAASTVMAILPVLFPRFPLPTAVGEIIAGIVIGPALLGWARPDDPVIHVLSTFGLAYLLFVAGLELDLRLLVRAPLNTLLAAYAFTLALAYGCCSALYAAGVVETPLFTTITLSASALGVLVPILKERGVLKTEFGQLVVTACVIGEVMPITLLSTFYASYHPTPLLQVGRVLGVALLAAMIAAMLVWTNNSPWMRQRFSSNEKPTTQIRVRQTMLILVGLAVAAHGAGVEVILGALAAGVVVATVRKRDATTEQYYGKIEAMGFGMFIPVFFVSVGLCFDVASLTSSTATMLKVPLYLGMLLLVRGLPAVLMYGRTLDLPQRFAAGFFQATNLAFIAAAIVTGLKLEKIRPGDATALIAAGMLSVIVFPQIGGAIAGRGARATGPI